MTYLNALQLSFKTVRTGPNIHAFWRFPGSFHSPICDWIIQSYTKESDVILDPMCGSGVLPIQAYLKGRRAYGYDIDPLSILMCIAKAYPYDLTSLRSEITLIREELLEVKRSEEELAKVAEKDEDDFIEKLPEIHNATHWFKKYALNDLGRILNIIEKAKDNDVFFRATLGTIVRYASNADPIPISGLEVTSHFSKKNNDRKIDVIGRYIERIDFAYKLIENFNAMESSTERPSFGILDINHIDQIEVRPDVVIFSPPYCSAIEYYRRHRLEYMLLGLLNHEEISARSKNYLGNVQVLLADEENITRYLAKHQDIASIINKVSNRKRRVCIAKYFVDTDRYLIKLSQLLKPNGRVVIVIGDSRSGDISIPTGDILLRLAERSGYSIDGVYEYPIRNKRMNYTKRNGANIKTEKILVLGTSGTK